MSGRRGRAFGNVGRGGAQGREIGDAWGREIGDAGKRDQGRGDVRSGCGDVRSGCGEVRSEKRVI